MVNYTIKDIIKIIPLDNELRQKLLNEFDTYDETKQYEIRHVCWEAFGELTDKLTELKYQQFLLDVEEGKKQLNPDMISEARRAVHQDYSDVLSGKKIETKQIEEIRDKLQSLSQVAQNR